MFKIERAIQLKLTVYINFQKDTAHGEENADSFNSLFLILHQKKKKVLSFKYVASTLQEISL